MSRRNNAKRIRGCMFEREDAPSSERKTAPKTGCSAIRESSWHGIHAGLDVTSQVHSPVVCVSAGRQRPDAAIPTADNHLLLASSPPDATTAPAIAPPMVPSCPPAAPASAPVPVPPEPRQSVSNHMLLWVLADARTQLPCSVLHPLIALSG